MITMNAVLQYLVVALLVAGSAVYSAWRLMPLASRLKLLEHAAATPLLGGIAAAPLARLRSRVVDQLKGGCAACSAGTTHHRVVKR